MRNDFGTGSLAIGGDGTIDMAGYWGGFEPGAVPDHAYRTLVVDSSTGASGKLVLGADVHFGRKRATGLFLEASGAGGMETKWHWAAQAGLRHSW